MYCKYCGKELKGKKCDCEKSKSKEINFSRIYNLIIDVLKKPTSTVSSYVKKGDNNTSIIMLISSIFLNSLLLMMLSDKLLSYIIGLFANIIYISKFKMFISIFLLELITVCILILLTWFISTKVFSNRKGDVKKTFNLVSISSVTIGVVSAILILINLILGFIFNDYIILLFSLILLLMSLMMFVLTYYSGLKKASELDYDQNCYLSIISIFGTLIILAVILNFIKLPITKNNDNYNNSNDRINRYNEIWW